MGYTEKWRLNARDLQENRNDLDYANSQPNENEIKNEVNEKLVQWYDRFGDYIQKVDFHLYNEACEYADGEQD